MTACCTALLSYNNIVVNPRWKTVCPSRALPRITFRVVETRISILAIVRIERRKSVWLRSQPRYQVTVPKVIAEQYNIRPGDDIDWVAAGDVIRVIPPRQTGGARDREAQLRLFDQATERHRRRRVARKAERIRDRGWNREDLYRRGRSR